mmetsp:Transcript_16385/g.43173  ORF Transcript_16385/g.43173 Transcript_16385/m.43173 type:complete len:223 (+) Transcript_16385:62-730(+)
MRHGAARDRWQVAAHGRHRALRPHNGAEGAAHREPELLDRARRRPQVVRVDGVVAPQEPLPVAVARRDLRPVLADAGRLQELQGLHVRVHDGHAVRHDARLDGQREEVRAQQGVPRQQAAPGVVEHELRRVGALARVGRVRHRFTVSQVVRTSRRRRHLDGVQAVQDRSAACWTLASSSPPQLQAAGWTNRSLVTAVSALEPRQVSVMPSRQGRSRNTALLR